VHPYDQLSRGGKRLEKIRVQLSHTEVARKVKMNHGYRLSWIIRPNVRMPEIIGLYYYGSEGYYIAHSNLVMD
jgi:hypothetical protein